jgi:hypothetical protein
MLSRRAQIVLAFDASGVTAVSVRRGLGGTIPRVVAAVPLDAGLVQPSIAERNITRPTELRERLVALLAEFPPRRDQAADLVLPAGVVRPLLIETAARKPRPEELHAHLAPALPFPVREAVTGTMRVGPSRHLAAGARRGLIEEYESVAVSAGLTPRRVELAPFLALAGLLRKPLPERAIDVTLGDRAVSFAVWGTSGPVAFRTRLRQVDDDARIWEEVERVASESGGAFPGARVAGRGARQLVEQARLSGRRATLAWEVPTHTPGVDASELAWLGGILA